MTVTDEMVETAWAAIVGGDIAKTCFNASIIRADLKTGLAAALAATPAVSGEADVQIAKGMYDWQYGAGAWDSSKSHLREHFVGLARVAIAATPAVGGELADETIDLALSEFFDVSPRIWSGSLRVAMQKAILTAQPASPLRGRDDLHEAVVMSENRLEAALLGDEVCKHCVELARSYLVDALSSSPPEQPAFRGRMLDQANYKIGAWLSAALEDPNVCAEMKADINAWFEAHQPGLFMSSPEQSAPSAEQRAHLHDMERIPDNLDGETKA
jgi:hypothetical protein